MRLDCDPVLYKALGFNWDKLSLFRYGNIKYLSEAEPHKHPCRDPMKPLSPFGVHYDMVTIRTLKTSISHYSGFYKIASQTTAEAPPKLATRATCSSSDFEPGEVPLKGSIRVTLRGSFSGSIGYRV